MGWNFFCSIAGIWPSLALGKFFRLSNFFKKGFNVHDFSSHWLFHKLDLPCSYLIVSLHREEDELPLRWKDSGLQLQVLTKRGQHDVRIIPPSTTIAATITTTAAAASFHSQARSRCTGKSFAEGVCIGGWVHRHSKLCLALLATKLAALSRGRHMDKLLHRRRYGVGTAAPL